MLRDAARLALVGALVLAACGDKGSGADKGAAREDSVVTTQDLAVNPGALQGTLITLENVQVASKMGPHAFWIQLPNENPYLVKLDSTVLASGAIVAKGETYTITGRVTPMSDSIMSAWEKDGTITDEGVKAEAQYATSFIQVNRMQRIGGPMAQDSAK
jgi:hypothetical protein